MCFNVDSRLSYGRNNKDNGYFTDDLETNCITVDGLGDEQILFQG